MSDCAIIGSMKTRYFAVHLSFLAVFSLFGACVTREVSTYLPPREDASAPLPPMPDAGAREAQPSAPPATSITDPRAQVPASSYRPGDFRQSLPSGTLTLPSLIDGGAPLRIHDGNDSPCMYGCVAFYSKVLDGERQQTGALVDAQEILKDATACVHMCQERAKAASWPGSER